MTEKRVANPKMVNVERSIANDKKLGELPSKDFAIKIRRDPHTGVVERTDFEERTVTACATLLKIISNPNQTSTYFTGGFLLWNLELTDEEIPIFFKQIEGFEVKEQTGDSENAPDYTLVDKDKAIASLEHLIAGYQEKESKDKERKEKQEGQEKKPEEKITRLSKPPKSPKPPKLGKTNYNLSPEEIANEIINDPDLKTRLQFRFSDREVTISEILRALGKIYHTSPSSLRTVWHFLLQRKIINETRVDKKGYVYYRLNK